MAREGWLARLSDNPRSIVTSNVISVAYKFLIFDFWFLIFDLAASA
jgi:hypothetical protein